MTWHNLMTDTGLPTLLTLGLVLAVIAWVIHGQGGRR